MSFLKMVWYKTLSNVEPGEAPFFGLFAPPASQEIYEDVNDNDYQKKYSALIESQVKA